MSELPETTTRSTPVATMQPAAEQKPYWLYRFAAWVVIVTGIVFVVSAVFLAGVYASQGGWHRHHHCHHHGHSMGYRSHHHGGPGPMFPGQEGVGPGELPSSVAPSAVPGR